MDIRKLQRAIVDGLEDVKAKDIVVFDTEALSPLFERVIIASGTSNRQTKALASSVRETVKSRGLQVLRTEGEAGGEWIIVDCGAAVAHIMQPAIRDYYHLEEIWGVKTVRMKLGPKPGRSAAAADRGGRGAAQPAAAKPPAPKQTAAGRTAAGVAAAHEAAAGRPATKKAPAKKAPAKKAPAKKAPARNAAAATTPQGKASLKQGPQKQGSVKQGLLKPVPARKPASKEATASKAAPKRSAPSRPLAARSGAAGPAAKKSAAPARRRSPRG